MSSPFVAEIRIVPFNFAPTGWAFCQGQILPISQNTALFSLLGTTYGGNGSSTFALPNLEGSAPMHPGQGPGLSLYDLGQTGGTGAITLLESEIPVHTHNIVTANAAGDNNIPTTNHIGRSSNGSVFALPPAGNIPPTVQLKANALSPTGGSLPHNNLQPLLTLNFIIALQGVFPPHP